MLAWLQTRFLPSPQSSDAPWILDPFSASPRAVLEAARAGCRVLVAANNPITRFILEVAAASPSEADLRLALAELAAARKGDERLEPHIRSLYQTACRQCGAPVIADAFLWDRSAAASPLPYACIYRCPACNHSGEQPASPEDIKNAAQYSSGGLHHARALERVAAQDDPDREHAEEALAAYLPRAVYALFTLINKLDGLPLPPERRNLLAALLLTACDQANTLWPHPTGRARPRQLTIPPRFREHNIWLALEQAVTLWASSRPPVPLVRWPEMPAKGGVSIFEGRLKDLAEWLPSVHISAVLAALPRPNQAFWTLSALWAGWLWGRDAVRPFKSVLRRRRYDWGWHTSALSAALESLAPMLPAGTPFFGVIAEAEPGFLSAAGIAASRAGFELDALVFQPESAQAQFHWRRPAARSAAAPPSQGEQIALARSASRSALLEAGEPGRYLSLHAASLAALAEAHAFTSVETAAYEAPAQLNAILEEALSYRQGFLRFGGSEKSLEIGHWWLRDAQDAASPLSDRVEVALVRALLRQPGAALPEILQAVYQDFPGLSTPDAGLIHVCLDSYAGQDPPESGRWRLLPQNSPKARQADLDEIAALLTRMAAALGWQASGRSPLLWQDASGRLVAAWHGITSGLIAEVLTRREYPPAQSFIVLPGGRANIVAFKLQHAPLLRQAVEEGWRFVKYRQVRQLAVNPLLDRASWQALLAEDSLTYDAPQLRFF